MTDKRLYLIHYKKSERLVKWKCHDCNKIFSGFKLSKKLLAKIEKNKNNPKVQAIKRNLTEATMSDEHFLLQKATHLLWDEISLCPYCKSSFVDAIKEKVHKVGFKSALYGWTDCEIDYDLYEIKEAKGEQ